MKSNAPIITVVTVVYNDREGLVNTATSIQNQIYKNYEHIIIDGNSTDGTVEYIQSLSGGNVKYISEKDKGIYDAMNKGVQIARGEYILFLNAGDTFYSENVLNNIANKVEELHNRPKIIYGSAYLYDTNNKFLTILKPLKFNKTNLDRFATRVVCHQSIFVARKSMIMYSDKYRLKSELNWYYDLVKTIDDKYIYKVDEIICNYYLGGTGDKHFWENFFERIAVAKQHNNIFVFIGLIPYFMISIIFRLRRIVFGK
ncbi:glycosyltransferase family 2 protein [Sulfurimonas sp.]